jgi:hypothetical protein
MALRRAGLWPNHPARDRARIAAHFGRRPALREPIQLLIGRVPMNSARRRENPVIAVLPRGGLWRAPGAALAGRIDGSDLGVRERLWRPPTAACTLSGEPGRQAGLLGIPEPSGQSAFASVETHSAALQPGLPETGLANLQSGTARIDRNHDIRRSAGGTDSRRSPLHRSQAEAAREPQNPACDSSHALQPPARPLDWA